MENIVFINGSPNKEGNTFKIGKEVLKNTNYDVLQMRDYKIEQYGAVTSNDEIKNVFKVIENANTIVIGTPVYWYSVSGLLKTFIDRLYLLPEAKTLKGKDLYFFAQGSAPDELTKKSITFLITRMAELMEMNLKQIIITTSDGEEIINNMNIA